MVFFFSRKLIPGKSKYSTYGRELLTIYNAVRYFQFLIEGREVIITTDRKPLLFAFNQKSNSSSPR